MYNQYVANKCQETKDNLVEALSTLVEDGDPVATKLNILLTEESSMSANFIHADYVNESEVKNFEKKLQEQRDKKTMDQIFSKVQRYIDEKLDDEIISIKENLEYQSDEKIYTYNVYSMGSTLVKQEIIIRNNQFVPYRNQTPDF